MTLVALVTLQANFDFDLVDVLACSSGSPSAPSNSIIQQFYCLAVASTELCELVVIVIVRTALL